MSAASIAPAPSPYGIAKTIIIQKRSVNEKPINAAAVKNTLTTVTHLVPNLRVNLSDSRLDTIVPPETTIVTMPMYETGTPSSTCITGQPEPSSESGSPRLMKAKYIKASKKVYIFTSRARALFRKYFNLCQSPKSTALTLNINIFSLSPPREQAPLSLAQSAFDVPKPPLPVTSLIGIIFLPVLIILCFSKLAPILFGKQKAR